MSTKLHSKRVKKMLTKLHSKRVKKMLTKLHSKRVNEWRRCWQNYTRNEWRRCWQNYTRNGWRRCWQKYTRNEWRRCWQNYTRNEWRRCWQNYTRNEWRRPGRIPLHSFEMFLYQVWMLPFLDSSLLQSSSLVESLQVLFDDGNSPRKASSLKLTVVFEYCEAIETYSRIWVLRDYRNLQSYLSTTRL